MIRFIRFAGRVRGTSNIRLAGVAKKRHSCLVSLGMDENSPMISMHPRRELFQGWTAFFSILLGPYSHGSLVY